MAACLPSHCSGWEPRVIWIGIGGSIFFTALEASKRFYAPKPVVKPCCAGKKAEAALK
jgi:solute carrier family 25 S-adenosylmethionine transporter 26